MLGIGFFVDVDPFGRKNQKARDRVIVEAAEASPSTFGNNARGASKERS